MACEARASRTLTGFQTRHRRQFRCPVAGTDTPRSGSSVGATDGLTACSRPERPGSTHPQIFAVAQRRGVYKCASRSDRRCRRPTRGRSPASCEQFHAQEQHQKPHEINVPARGALTNTRGDHFYILLACRWREAERTRSASIGPMPTAILVLAAVAVSQSGCSSRSCSGTLRD